MNTRKTRYQRRAMILIEAMVTLSILTMIGLILLKISLNILHPRQWTLQQTITDAYLTYERSYAERIPFEQLVSEQSPWPASPQTQTSEVEIGRLPGNQPIFGKVIRTRIPADTNFPIDGGSGNPTINPASMKIWKAQSVLSYEIGGKDYLKSRTVIRSQ